MEHPIFAVYDSTAKAFLPPFTLPNVGMAKRIFTECANNPEHQWSKTPADYTLFVIGTIDIETGEIINNNENENLGVAASFKYDPIHDSGHFISKHKEQN